MIYDANIQVGSGVARAQSWSSANRKVVGCWLLHGLGLGQDTQVE